MTITFPERGEFFEGRYAIDDVLAQTSFSRVYRATDTHLSLPVALKLARPDAGDDPAGARRLIARFRREAALLSQLRDEHTVTLYDHGQTSDGGFFLAFEFVEGQTLRERIRAEGALGPERTVEVLRQVLASLGEAHRLGTLHRDLKPENIMVAEAFGPLRVKVLDFGIAKPQDADPEEEDLTAEGTVVGTPRYMAPEQLRGKALGPYTDIYSLGLIAYEMLTGRRAIDAEGTVEILAAQLDPAAIVLPGDVAAPPRLRAIVERMLDKLPQARYASTDALLADLAQVPAADALPAVPLPLGDDATEVLPTEDPELSSLTPPGDRLMDYLLDQPTEVEEIASVDSEGRVVRPTRSAQKPGPRRQPPPSQAPRAPETTPFELPSGGASALGLREPDERPVAGPQRTDAEHFRFPTPTDGTPAVSKAPSRSGCTLAIVVALAIGAALVVMIAIGAWIAREAYSEGMEVLEAQLARQLDQARAMVEANAESVEPEAAQPNYSTDGILQAVKTGGFAPSGPEVVEVVGEIERLTQRLRRGKARVELQVLLLADDEAARRQVEGTEAPARAVRFGRKAAVVLPDDADDAEAAADLAATLERYRELVDRER